MEVREGRRLMTEVGILTIQRLEHGPTGAYSLSMLHADAVTAITPDMLGLAMRGELPHIHVDGDRLVFDLDNGRWVYGIGEYDADLKRTVLRLVEGEPISGGVGR